MPCLWQEVLAFLKMLRNKKSYYYKTRHFTAVSGMIYRMKQNAVGLANICILSTMVLVLVSMTVPYMGVEWCDCDPFSIWGANHKFRNQSKRRRTNRRNYKEYDKEKSHNANFTDTFSCRADLQQYIITKRRSLIWWQRGIIPIQML